MQYYFAEFYDRHRRPSRERISLRTRDKRAARQKFTALERDVAMGLRDPWVDSYEKDAVLLTTDAPDDFEFAARDHLAHRYGHRVLPGLNSGRSGTNELLELIQTSRRLGAPGIAIFSRGGLFPDHQPGETARAPLAGPFSQRVDLPDRR